MINRIVVSVLCVFLFSFNGYSQTISEIINTVNLDSLQLTLREFTGEQTTLVNDVEVTIKNRHEANNDIAADYLLQKFEQYDNLIVTDQTFNTNGRNIIATQMGKTNPDDIYIICAHYDTLKDYCADDNASGTATVLEIARILSEQCLNNTIVYALWDEEEKGLLGAQHYANLAATQNKNILGVLNIDMMGYDGNADKNFDIDVRDVANSLGMKDDIISILNTPEYGFTLKANVVNPGTPYSDHSKFWDKEFSAVLVGESWETDDATPFYHQSTDRYATLNFPYYHELAKLIMGYMVTKGDLVQLDNSVSQTAVTLKSNQNSASYKWIDCTTNLPIPLATNQTFTPSVNGVYAVEVSSGNCTELSDCVVFNSLSIDSFLEDEVKLYPNPVNDILKVEMAFDGAVNFSLYNASGALVLDTKSSKRITDLNLKSLAKGAYILKVKTPEKSGAFKVIKD